MKKHTKNIKNMYLSIVIFTMFLIWYNKVSHLHFKFEKFSTDVLFFAHKISHCGEVNKTLSMIPVGVTTQQPISLNK